MDLKMPDESAADPPHQIPLPCYQCHKKVWALKIAAIEVHEDKSATITPAEHGYGLFRTPPGWLARLKGHEGDLGYYVVGIGYTSWSPAKAFEEGYTLIPVSAFPGQLKV